MLTKQQIEKQLKKEMIFVKEFTADYSDQDGEETGSFAAYNLALNFCEQYGINSGSMERSSPIGLAFNAEYISKWSNLGSDVEFLDGALVSESFRSSGKVTLYFSKELKD